MIRLRSLYSLLVLALVGTLAAGTQQAARSSSGPAARAAGQPLDARTGTLTSRLAGLPAPGAAPARRLKSAKVTQDLLRGRVRATVVLRGVPTATTSGRLHVEFGHRNGTVCNGDQGFDTPTTGTLSTGFARSRATFTLNRASDQAGYETWDCAFAALTDPGATQNHDALVGALRDVVAKPKLRFGEVKLLRTKVGRVRLVRNVWTVLEARVRNAGRADAPGVTVRGAGKGLRVRGVRVGKIYHDGSALARVKVRLVGRRRSTLFLSARSAGVKAVRRISVIPVKPPRRPVAGRYRTKNGHTTFRIRKGRVVQFRTTQYTQCGGYPDLPTYTWNYYNFPTAAIARNGIVNARQHRKLYSVGLEMRAVGAKVRQGYFYYSGPNRCFASERFTARRVGR